MTADPEQPQYSALGKGTFPAGASYLLESPLRKLIKSPTKVAARLHLKPNQRVLEVGAGSGYYSTEVASRLHAGRLVMADLQPDMLARAALALAAHDLANGDLVLADAESLPLAPDRFDVVFMVTVLGEVNDPTKALEEVYRVLHPGGLLSIGEQRTDPDFLTLRTVQALAGKAGFTFEKRYGWFWNYTANFRKSPS